MHKPIHMHTDAQTLRFSTEERGGMSGVLS